MNTVQDPTIDQLADNFAEKFSMRLGAIEHYTQAMYGRTFPQLAVDQKMFVLEMLAHAVDHSTFPVAEHNLPGANVYRMRTSMKGLDKAVAMLNDQLLNPSYKPLLAALIGRFADSTAYSYLANDHI